MDELVDTAVLQRASQDSALSEQGKLFVLAALEGAGHLDQAVSGEAPPQLTMALAPSGPEAGGQGCAEQSGPPAWAYLSRITVTGFRGVGPEASIAFQPGPGLTVVAGRNGSGKSSFAEALELALTRRSYRWTKRTAVWSESWRNLRQPDPARIVIRLAEEGAGVTTVCAEWTTDAALNDVTIWTQRPGGKRGDLADLGWDRDLELFRPFLSYDELGALFAEPSKLHDALASILGLDRLEDAVKLLGERLKELAAPGKEATNPDLAAVSALVIGAAPADPQLAGLHVLAAVTAPDLAGWHSARAEHDAAAETHREALAAAGAAALSSTSLLRAAMEHYEQHGDGPCPSAARAYWTRPGQSSRGQRLTGPECSGPPSTKRRLGSRLRAKP